MSAGSRQDMLQPPVSDWIAAFNSRDLKTIVALYVDDAELFDAGMRRPRRGKQEIEHWFRLRFSSMPENVYTPRHKPEMEAGRVVVPWTLCGHGPRLLGQSWLSHSFQVDGTSYFTLHAGRIYRQHGVYDHLTVLRQVLPPLRWCPAFVAATIYYLYLWRHKQL